MSHKKILIDHGAYGNIGDASMIEGVVSRLSILLPEAELCVIYRECLKTAIWDIPNVSKENEYHLRLFLEDVFQSIPFSWRRFNNWRKTINKFTLMNIGGLVPAKLLSLNNMDESGIQRRKLWEFCENFDGLHIAGGGNLTDVFYNELFNRCCLMHVFAEQGKPIVLTGQQLGPFYSRSSKKSLQKALRKVNFVGIREPGESLRFCKEANIQPDCYAIMGDDSFGLLPSDSSDVTRILSEHELHENEFLAFNVRIGNYAKEFEGNLFSVAEILDKIGWYFQMPVLIVPIALGEEDSDIKAGEKLAKITKSHVRVMRNFCAPAVTKGIMGKAFGAVGVSYHFCTFALSRGVPAVCLYDGLYYSQKADGLCGFWGDRRLALSLRNVDVDSAVAHIIQVLKDESLRQKINSRAREAEDCWQKIFDEQIKIAFG
jgi:polysaccharide pyruvyl transferase WcaK-like protein